MKVCRARSLLFELVLEYQGSMEDMATTDGIGAVNRNVGNNGGDDLVFNIFDKFLSEKPDFHFFGQCNFGCELVTVNLFR
jgi:hypothetical protein